MAQCDFNADLKQELGVSLSRFVSILNSGKLTPEEAHTRLKNFLMKYKDYTPLDNVISTIMSCAQVSGLSANKQVFPWRRVPQLKAFLTSGEEAINSKVEDLSDARLEKNDPARYRKQLNKDFLEKAFGLAVNVRNRAKIQINDDLYNHTVINLKPGQTNGVIMTTEALNVNLRSMQQDHLNNVINYLVHLYEEASTEASKINVLKQNAVMYDSEGNYTGAVDNIYHYADEVLNPEKFTANILNDLTNSTQKLDQEQLQAYISWLVLNNFDSMLFGAHPSMQITVGQFGDLVFGKTYSFADKGDSNATNWTDQDDFEISENINKFTVNTCNTTPLFVYGTSTPLSYQVCSIQDFSRAIIDIRRLLYADTDIFFEFNQNNPLCELSKKPYKKLSPETFELIKNDSLKGLIANIRSNPGVYTQAVFELLSTPEVLNRLRETGCLKTRNGKDILSRDTLNLIYSFNHRIFDRREPNSIYSVNLKDMEVMNIYEYICQSVDSICEVKQVQHYSDENDSIQTRELSGDMLSKLRRDNERTINAHNSKLLPGFQDKVKNYNIKKVTNSTDITLTIAGKECTWSQNGQVTISGESNTNKIDANFCKTFFDITGLQIEESWDYSELRYGINTLITIAADVLARQYINNVITTNTSQKGIEQQLLQNEYNSENFPITRFGEISMISKSRLPDLEILTSIQGRENGLLGGVTIKDSDGTQQSRVKTAHLQDNNTSQFEILNKTYDSATTQSLIQLQPELIKGVYSINNFKNNNNSTSRTDFSASESAYESLVLLFGQGFQVSSKDTLFGNGNFGIIPSANSDKSTITCIDINGNIYVGVELATENSCDCINKIFNTQHVDKVAIMNFLHKYSDRIKVNDKPVSKLSAKELKALFKESDYKTLKQILNDVNEPITYHTTIKELVKLTNAELDQLIREELGSIYLNTAKTVNNDFKTLLKWANAKYKTTFSIFQDVVKDNFDTLNLQLQDYINDQITKIQNKINITPVDQVEVLQNLQNKLNWLRKATPVQVIKKFTLAYNLEHRNNPIGFIDQTHYIAANGKLYANPVLTNYLYRYTDLFADMSPADLLVKHPPFPSSQIIDQKTGKVTNLNNQQLYDLKTKTQILCSFIRSGLVIDTLDPACKVFSEDSAKDWESYYNIKDMDKWVSEDTKELIYAKITIDGNPFNIRSKYDMQQLDYVIGKSSPDFSHVMEAVLAGRGTFKLNPAIERYNKLHYLLSQEYVVSTVGSLINHPSKKFGKLIGDWQQAVDTNKDAFRRELSQSSTEEEENQLINKFHTEVSKSIPSRFYFEQEAERYAAQDKRNVSNTASMKEFMLGALNGIPRQYNVAVIDDFKDQQYNITGEIAGIKPQDGAMFVNPFLVYLENNSLKGEAAGLTKKQFVHFYNSQTGTGGIIKTCGFAITNNNMQNIPLYRKWVEKMCNHAWLDQNGQEIDCDITKDFKDRDVFGYGGGALGLHSIKPIIFKKDGAYYEITKIKKVAGKNRYTVEGNILNVESQRGTINGKKLGTNSTNVDLSYLFADVRGMDVQGSTVQINSNWALWNLFGAQNSLKLVGDQLVQSETSIENVVTVMNYSGVRLNKKTRGLTQDDVYQFMKHSDIHYLCNTGAVKQGACNVNSADKFNNDEAFDFFKINMLQAGIQLDKEHHATNTELAIMTQVISACAHRGYSLDAAMELYQSLSKLAAFETEGISNPFEKLRIEGKDSENAKKELLKSVVTRVVESISRDSLDEGNLMSAISQDLVKIIKSGKKLTYENIKGKFPIDDPSIFSQFIKEIQVYMTKAIKLKIPGQLNVLTPSYGLFKIYAGRTWAEIENNEHGLLAEEELQRIFDEEIPELAIGGGVSWADVRIGRQYCVQYADGRVQFEKITTPRDLYNLKSRLNNPLAGVVSFKEDITVGRDLGSYNVVFNADAVDANGAVIANSEQRFQLYDLDAVQALFMLQDIEKQGGFTSTNFEALWNLIPNHDMAVQVKANSNNDFKKFKNDLAKELRKDIFNFIAALSPNGKKIRDVNDNKLSNICKINGEWFIPNRQSVVVEPYELACAKRSRDQFGLTDQDQLYTIMHTTDAGGNNVFFERKLLSNFMTVSGMQESNFTVELKRGNGKHIYILDKSQLNETNGLTRINIQTDIEDGNLYRCDPVSGNKMYQLNQKTEGNEVIEDEVYIDQQGNEIIVASDPYFYMKRGSYYAIRLSSKLSSKAMKDFVENMGDEVSDIAKMWKLAILRQEDAAAYNNELLKDVISLESTNNAIIGQIKTQAKKMYNSFLHSLKVVASRTPSQSMQSFMPMKIAAFETTNINNAYVSTAQIWLQGSDYDVDAVSTAMFDIDRNGMLQTWSPYSDLKDTASAEQSLKLPFPTFEEIKFDKKGIFAQNPTADVLLEDTVLQYKKLIDIAQQLNLQYKTSEKGTRVVGTISALGEIIRKVNEVNFYKLSDDLLGEGNGKISQEEANKLRALVSLANYHNTWLSKRGRSEIESAMKNFSMARMYEIILDPINLIQAQQSVDSTTEEPKDLASQSEKASLSKHMVPGNFLNIGEKIFANQVGKDCIGICAVGLKSFFALSYYTDYVLRNKNAADIERLKLQGQKPKYDKKTKQFITGPDGKPLMEPGDIKIAGTTYNTIINILNSADELRASITNPTNEAQNQRSRENLLKLAADIDASGVDGALAISALLSLSTDNAKELALDKLNAGKATISLYIFGLSVGMSFKGITDILMSPTGNLIMEKVGADHFNDNFGQKVLQVVDYYSKLPNAIFNKYTSKRFATGDDYGSYTSVGWTYKNKLISLLKEGYVNKEGQTVKLTEKDFLGNKDAQRDIMKKMSDWIYSLRQDLQVDARRLDRDMHEYLNELKNINQAQLNDISTMAKGAEEMRILGAILGLNGGLETGLNESWKVIEEFEELLPEGMTIVDFCYNKSSRNSAINAYENRRAAFNILDCIATTPQFFAYLKMAACAFGVESAVSNRFRFIWDQKKRFKQVFQKSDGDTSISKKDSEYLVKGLGNYYSDASRDAFYLDKKMGFKNVPDLIGIAGHKFLPKGTMKDITLGYADGNATFKYYMETVVIPKLKQMYPDNAFIKDLCVKTSDKTPGHNIIIRYSLPTNMMPKSPTEQSRFDAYQNAFNELCTKPSYQIGDSQMNVADLFYIYAQIAHFNKSGQESLMPILTTWQCNDQSLAHQYHLFEAQEHEFEPTPEEIYPYIIPVGSQKDVDRGKTRYVLNKDTFKYELYTQGQKASSITGESDSYYTGGVPGAILGVEQLQEDIFNETFTIENDVYLHREALNPTSSTLVEKVANKYIGFGRTESAIDNYVRQLGAKANSQVYDLYDQVLVGVPNGTCDANNKFYKQTVELAKSALTQGATIIINGAIQQGSYKEDLFTQLTKIESVQYQFNQEGQYITISKPVYAWGPLFEGGNPINLSDQSEYSPLQIFTKREFTIKKTSSAFPPGRYISIADALVKYHLNRLKATSDIDSVEYQQIFNNITEAVKKDLPESERDLTEIYNALTKRLPNDAKNNIYKENVNALKFFITESLNESTPEAEQARNLLIQTGLKEIRDGWQEAGEYFDAVGSAMMSVRREFVGQQKIEKGLSQLAGIRAIRGFGNEIQALEIVHLAKINSSESVSEVYRVHGNDSLYKSAYSTFVDLTKPENSALKMIPTLGMQGENVAAYYAMVEQLLKNC